MEETELNRLGTERRDCNSFMVIKFLGKLPRQALVTYQTGEGTSKTLDVL
jgi:hypothetical protein